MDRLPDTASLRALMEDCSLAETVKNGIKPRLVDFPHTFQLQDQDRLRPTQLKKLRSGLESALSVGYETEIETARARNMLAYILCRLNKLEDALETLQLVLGMDDQQHNLVTLANKAVILCHQMNFSEAEEIVQSLIDLKTQEEEFPYLVVRAKAELAFTYTRLGPSFSPQAIAIFEEVIPKAREPEVWLWKFGLGLTRRRSMRANPQAVSATPSPETAAEQRDLLSLFMDTAEKCSSTNLKAKIYSEMAVLLFTVSKIPLWEEFYSRAGMTAEQACERALELDSTDNSVLCKCGKILRYCGQTERSWKLLEKAVSIRPSSTGHHHLANTYKALAKKEKYKDTDTTNTVKSPGHSKQSEELDAEPRGTEKNGSARQPLIQGSVGGSQCNMSASATSVNNVDSGAAASGENHGPMLSSNRDIRRMQKMLKSPPKGVTRFTRGDKYIKEALHHFQKAIKFSRGENTRATYDLAILLKSLGELEEAKKQIQEMPKYEYCLFVTERINIYDQMGLIMKELAESETDEGRKRRMLEDSTTLHYRALISACKIFSKSPGVKEQIGELYCSFSVLFQAIEKSDKSDSQKLQEKADLFTLINDHKQSLELLQEIEQMDSKQSEDPQYLKLRIETYVAVGQYEKALTFVNILKVTQQSTGTMRLFEDEHYVLKIYMQAARQALLNGDSSIASLWFRPAFLEAVHASQNENSSSECSSDSSEDSKYDTEAWDVYILHEESRESWTSATALGTLLKDTFGLKVAITGRDALPVDFDLDAELCVMERSTMVIVLAGGKLSETLRFYINNVAKKPLTVTLLVDGEHVPQVLKARRCMTCPPELLQRCKNAEKTEAEVDTICKVFAFLVNVDLYEPEA